LAQQPEQTGDPSLILQERLPLAFMQITHFKISPLFGRPVLRDATAAQELNYGDDRKPPFPASRGRPDRGLMLETVET
jgi:hypothetical protein